MRIVAVGLWFAVMQKTFWLVLGWMLVAVGVVLLPAPIPVPLIGVMPILIGLAILTTHSKNMRRRLQFTRHRFDWLSRRLDGFAHRVPDMVKSMIHRTRPNAIHRHARIQSRRDDGNN
ncbi:MAG: PGPGW domain-containing protein [Alphaproteobacteria bacterium]|nr:PGPGW domain-containing protein [Alphaproteobacteria bacterium]